MEGILKSVQSNNDISKGGIRGYLKSPKISQSPVVNANNVITKISQSPVVNANNVITKRSYVW